METKYIKFSNFIDSTQYGYTAEETSLERGDAKYLRITDIVPYFVDKKNVPFCKISDDKKKQYIISEGDLLIARTGATTGYNLVVDNTFSNFIFASYLIRFYLKKEKVFPQYVKHVLKSDLWYGFVNNYIGGSAQPGMNARVFGKFYFPYFPLPTQQKIASILSAYDNLIQNYKKQIEDLQTTASELYKEWFVRFRFPGYKTTQFENGIPVGWKVEKLNSIMEVKYGKDHSKIEDGLIPILGSGGVMRFGNKALYSKESVLIPRKGSLNNVMYMNRPFWTVDTMFYSEIKIENTAKYMYYVLSGIDLASFNSGAALPSMTTEILYHFKIILPSESLLQKFDRKIELLFSKIHNLEQQITNLTQQRDLLLPRLMSGKLEVE